MHTFLQLPGEGLPLGSLTIDLQELDIIEQSDT